MLFAPGDEEHRPIVMRVTPDHIAMDLRGLYVEDYKTTSRNQMYFKFKEIKDGLDWGYRMQLSIQSYAFYVKHGIEITRGRINYICRDDNNAQIVVESELFTFDEVEEFLLARPEITQDFNKDGSRPKKIMKAACHAYQEHKPFICGFSKTGSAYCEMNDGCPFKRTKEEIVGDD
jgi:hypothetical protein